MEILEPPEGSGPVTGFVWLLLLPIFIIIGIFILPIYYTYKNREKIAEKVEEFEDEQTNREIQSGIQWRAILRINAIFYGGSFSIIGVLLGLTSILYNVENPEGKTGATLSMEQSTGIFLISIIVLAILFKYIKMGALEPLEDMGPVRVFVVVFLILIVSPFVFIQVPFQHLYKHVSNRNI